MQPDAAMGRISHWNAESFRYVLYSLRTYTYSDRPLPALRPCPPAGIARTPGNPRNILSPASVLYIENKPRVSQMTTTQLGLFSSHQPTGPAFPYLGTPISRHPAPKTRSSSHPAAPNKANLPSQQVAIRRFRR